MFVATKLPASPLDSTPAKLVPASAPKARQAARPAAAGRRWDRPAFRWSVLGVAAVLLLAGAGGSTFLASKPAKAKQVAVYMTDAPPGFDRFDVRVSGVYIGSNGYPLTLLNPKFNVLDYQGTQKSLKIAEGTIPAGQYHQVAVVFSSAKAVIQGASLDLAIPHKMLKVTSGVDLKGPQGSILLELDVAKSVVSTPEGLEFHPFVANAWKEETRPSTEAANPAMPDLSANGFVSPPTPEPQQHTADPPQQSGKADEKKDDATDNGDETDGGGSDEGGEEPAAPDGMLPPKLLAQTFMAHCGTVELHANTGPKIPNKPADGQANAVCALYMANVQSLQEAYDAGDQQLTYLVKMAREEHEIVDETVEYLEELEQLCATCVPEPLQPVQDEMPDLAHLGLEELSEAGIDVPYVDHGILTGKGGGPSIQAASSNGVLDLHALTATYGMHLKGILANANAFIVKATPASMIAFQQANPVTWVQADVPGLYLSSSATPAQTSHWSAPYAFSGEGTGVGIIDSGIDTRHPALPGDLTGTRMQGAGERLVVLENTMAAPGAEYYAAASVLPPLGRIIRTPTNDAFGHGTGVAGVIAAVENPQAVRGVDVDFHGPGGLAPGARIYGCAMGDLPTLVLATACLDELISLMDQPTNPQDPPIRVVTLAFTLPSFEDESFPNSPFYDLMAQAIVRGVTFVIAAGEAPASTTVLCATPLPGVICVGGAHVPPPTSDAPADRAAATLGAHAPSGLSSPDAGVWQSRWRDPFYGGPFVVDYRSTWPDVCAASENVLTTSPIDWALIPYVEMSGTSMAVPQVAAAIAAMNNARGERGPLAPWDAVQILRDSAYAAPGLGPYFEAREAEYGGAGWQCGHGLLDIEAAVALAVSAGYP